MNGINEPRPEEARDIKPGSVIDGLFVVQGFLGEGAMGEIYLVKQESTGRNCALKMLSARSMQANARARFVREANLLARLDHPGITTVFNAGFHAGTYPYYVMELIQGTTLSDLVKEQGALEEKDAIEIFLDLSEALAYAHGKGVVHRDIKPSNIMVKFDQQQGYQAKSAKLLDFGIAKLVGGEGDPTQGLTATGQVVGSPLYMSPEQGLGQRLDNRSDLYSLGCSMFEALTGKPPFHGANALETIGMHQSSLPPKFSKVASGRLFDSELEEFVVIALRKNPAERFQSAGEFNTELKAVKEKIARRPLVRTAARLAAISLQNIPKLEEAESTEELAVRKKGEPKAKLMMILSAVAAGLVLFVGSIVLFTGKGAEKQAEPPKPAGIERHIPARGEYYKGIVEKDGHRFKHYVLPPELSFGDFWIIDKTYREVHEYFVPVGGIVTFSASKDICMKPEYFEGFDDEAFSGLMLDTCSLVPTEPGSLLPLRSIDVMPIIKRITRFKKVETLSLARTNLDDEGLALLWDMRAMRDLRLTDTEVTPEAVLAYCKKIRLTSLTVDDQVAGYVPLLECLAKQQQIGNLTLEKTLFSEDAFKALSKCRGLVYLTLRFSSFDEKNLAYLAPLTNLQLLDLASCNLTSKCFKYLKPFKKLSVLHITVDKYTAAEKQELFKCLPPDCHVD